MIGAGEAVKGHERRPQIDLTGHRPARWSGAGRLRRSRRDARGHPVRLDLRQLHDHRADAARGSRLLPKGEGGRFVADGNLISGVGRLPFNTDGGGLCNNHPANRGGITKVIEAVRQLRGEAHPAVQVRDCGLALATGIGGQLGCAPRRATVILERE